MFNLFLFSFQCYCDRQNPPLTASASESECSTKCPGNDSEYCGAVRRISVFRTGWSGISDI